MDARHATRTELGGGLGVAALLAYAYPLVFAAGPYLTWLAAWACLGHRPRPSLDDPKYIGLAVDVPYFLSAALTMAVPVAIGLGLIVAVAAGLRAGKTSSAKLGLTSFALMALVSLWAGVIVFLRADPWQVLNWYWD